MKFAIIAAGEGARLREDGINIPKPLVEVGGEKLIDRLIRIFINNGANEVVVICNDLYPETDSWLKKREQEGLPIKHIVKTTPSSMHSFYELRNFLRGDKFILTTVDTIFKEENFSEYVNAFRNSGADAMMAVTDFIDDEKPLYVKTNNNNIAAFLDSDPQHVCQFISAGIYGLNDRAIDTLERCMTQGKSRMRNFQRGLIEDGLDVRAYPIGKVFDIDHKSDIDKANMLIS